MAKLTDSQQLEKAYSDEPIDARVESLPRENLASIRERPLDIIPEETSSKEASVNVGRFSNSEFMSTNSFGIMPMLEMQERIIPIRILSKQRSMNEINE